MKIMDFFLRSYQLYLKHIKIVKKQKVNRTNSNIKIKINK
jgi:hypothetical protein